MNIIFIAPPGAGKGTQAKKLTEYYNIPHISTGDLLREETKKDTEFARYISKKISNGEFVSDDEILEILKGRLEEDDCGNGYILDGYPRNLTQAKRYEEMLRELGINEGVVIYLNLSREIALERITGRRFCSSCGASYNIYNEALTPKIDGICDKCESNLSTRSDDNPETYNKRYDTYLKETAPLIDFYKEKGILKEIKIDKNTKASDVFEIIKNILED